MKKGLMTQFPFARGRAFVCKNIGDYVQSVASRQYIDKVDEYIEQEEANNYFPEDKQKAKLIMNGWFQWRAENFPPSEYIEPLLISMHISPLRQEQLLTESGIAFLRNFGPVGCRDYYTKSLLESKGVPAYFSGCVTLTLGKQYKVSADKRHGIYFVDPYFDIPDLKSEIDGKIKIHLWRYISFGLYYITHFPIINSLAKRSFFKDYMPTGFIDKDRSKLRPFYKAVMFHKVYKKKFTGRLLKNAEYITHWLYVDMATATNDELLDYAESLVKKYAAAKLVITSRIHAGLPSLGLETPVVFIANKEVISENGSFNTPGRLNGLVELFRILSLENGYFSTDDDVLKNYARFDIGTVFANKDDYKPIAEKLDKQCTEFMNS